MVQGGWTPRQFADAPGGFTLEELDGVAPNNPLFVQEGYSLVYANSLALKAVGLNPADGARLADERFLLREHVKPVVDAAGQHWDYLMAAKITQNLK